MAVVNGVHENSGVMFACAQDFELVIGIVDEGAIALSGDVLTDGFVMSIQVESDIATRVRQQGHRFGRGLICTERIRIAFYLLQGLIPVIIVFLALQFPFAIDALYLPMAW